VIILSVGRGIYSTMAKRELESGDNHPGMDEIGLQAGRGSQEHTSEGICRQLVES